MRLPEHVKAQAIRIVSSVSHPLVQFKGLQLDQGLLKFTLYLFEADGAMMSAVFHELYHKWQFSVSMIRCVLALPALMSWQVCACAS